MKLRLMSLHLLAPFIDHGLGNNYPKRLTKSVPCYNILRSFLMFDSKIQNNILFQPSNYSKSLPINDSYIHPGVLKNLLDTLCAERKIWPMNRINCCYITRIPVCPNIARAS